MLETSQNCIVFLLFTLQTNFIYNFYHRVLAKVLRWLLIHSFLHHFLSESVRWGIGTNTRKPAISCTTHWRNWKNKKARSNANIFYSNDSLFTKISNIRLQRHRWFSCWVDWHGNTESLQNWQMLLLKFSFWRTLCHWLYVEMLILLYKVICHLITGVSSTCMYKQWETTAFQQLWYNTTK